MTDLENTSKYYIELSFKRRLIWTVYFEIIFIVLYLDMNSLQLYPHIVYTSLILTPIMLLMINYIMYLLHKYLDIPTIYKIHYIINQIFNVVFITLFLISLLSIIPSSDNKLLNDLSTIGLYMLDNVMLYFPLIILFMLLVKKMLSKKGIILIELEKLNENISSYSKRKIWMERILKKYARILQDNYIAIDHNNMIHNINLHFYEDDKLKNIFQKIGYYLLNEPLDETIFDTLKLMKITEEIKITYIFSFKNSITFFIKKIEENILWIITLIIWLINSEIGGKMLESLPK